MRALVVDDERTTSAIVAAALQRWGVESEVVHDGQAAWQALTVGSRHALMIVDWMMPGLDGVELCRRVREDPALSGLYIILLTGRTSRSDVIAGLEAGADDYMIKPIHTAELRARVLTGIRIASLQQGLAERVAELQSVRDHLTRLASTDALTELYSRRWWFELAANEFGRALRYRRDLSLLTVDLDFFKQVNDTFGHQAGDRLLRAFGEILRDECRQSDIIGRLGGEEFAVLLPETPLASANVIAERLRDACRGIAIATQQGIVECTCSVGLSGLQAGDASVEDVLRRADAALYRAKHTGRDRVERDDSRPLPAPAGVSTGSSCA